MFGKYAENYSKVEAAAVTISSKKRTMLNAWAVNRSGIFGKGGKS